MAGKAYTMREMRAMVEYLSEHKAYGELKGRKMWTEFANSDKTTRTWQSLKETFLKRILPDIHNPYYRLTMDEIRSFQQGVDVAEKEKNNRLEFRTVHDNLNGGNQKGPSTVTKENEVPTTSHEREEPSNINNEPPFTSIDDEMEKVTGEDIKAAKIPSRSRSSTETLVLEYENAEEVQRVLESPKTTTDAKSKSLKDKLTFEYTAPLTPLVQDLLHDFETESEASDAEPRLNIDENLPKTNNTESEVVVEAVLDIKTENVLENNMINNEADCVIEICDTKISDNTEISSKHFETLEANETSNTNPIHAESDKTLNSEIDKSKLTSNHDTDTHKNIDQNSQQDDSVTIVESNLEDIAVLETAVPNDKKIENSENIVKNDTDNCIIPNTENSTQNITLDTLLPNNPEALNDSNKDTQKKSEKISDKAKTNENRLRKRSSSRDSRESKKQKMTDVNSKDRRASLDEIHEPLSPSLLKEKSVNALEKQPAISDTPVIEISSDTTTINNTGEQIDVLSKQTLKNLSEPSVDTEKNILNIAINQKKNSTEIEDKNLCLLSVSLYEEQFKNAKYSDTDSDKATKQKQNSDKAQVVTEKSKEIKNIPQKAMNKKETELGIEKETPVVTVDSDREVDIRLESSVACELPNQRVVNNNKNATVRVQREKALANAFGFAHGHVAPSSRKRHLSHRRRSHHQRRYSKQINSNSSEWTSESDSESYVSPPRSRRNKHTKRYLKPKSSRILQDPEEEMLYVLFGKNIYPLVKDGKHIKKYLTYTPDSGTDEEGSFWKQKYIEEKKRVADFRKLLKETNDTQATNKSTVPLISQNNSESRSPRNATENVNSKQFTSDVETKAEPKDDKIVLKIAGRNGLEYCLEGGWNQVSNAMPQVVQMLRCEMAIDDRKPNLINGTGDQSKADIQMAVGNGATTPVPAIVDAEVHEKVNKLESEIFNEIKNLEVQQMKEEIKEIETDNSNVTKRKPNKPKESLPTTSKGPSKRGRPPKTNPTDAKQDEHRSKRMFKLNTNADQEEIKGEPTKTADQPSDAEQKELTAQIETNVDEKHKKASLRKSSARLSKQREINEQNDDLDENALVGTRASTRLLRTPKKFDSHSSESDVKPQAAPNKESTKLRSFNENARYMFPPEKNMKKSTGNKKSLPKINIIPSQELGNSVDNAYGYEDSDPSPMKLCLSKRKRKVSFTARNKCKNRRLRRKSFPLLEQPSSDSNNSAYFIPLRRSLSSLNSEIYRSNSFQWLMPKQNISSKKLERIDENIPALVKYDSDIRYFSSVSKVSIKSSENSGFALEMGNSSNVSLPFSPELSVVENISICRDEIKDDEPPTINETQQNINNVPMDYSEYMISNIDVSVPLMDQRCNLRKSTGEVTSLQNASKCDSMQLKDCTVNLTMSDTLDQRLRELLLESTKKPTEDKNKQTPMEVDQTSVTTKKSKVRKRKENIAMDVDESKVAIKKTRANKRSSTPQKKKTVLKGKTPTNTIIEEEHVESCSAGRKSCPPVMTFIPIDENANNSSDISFAVKVASKKKKIKDIIKVKIHKPKDKNRSKENLRGKSVGDGSLASTYTDSGINDTETISLMLKDCSVDLIHNHSETCLLANDCIGRNSVEFIQNSSISVISLTSSRQSEDEFSKMPNNVVLSEDTSVQDNKSSEARTSDNIFESPEKVYHSPPYGSISSLITEDLSSSPPKKPTKWYLLEEDVTNPESASNVVSFGSNLNQIFPITCAVPNLSTISEMSKENEDSRKNSI